MIIDFTKKQLLLETWSEMLGSWSKTLLRYMYGDDVKIVANVTGVMKEEDGQPAKFVIRGRYKDVQSYAQALAAEKNYLDAYVQYGPDSPQAVKTRELLRQAVERFEYNTQLKWPFTDEE